MKKVLLLLAIASFGIAGSATAQKKNKNKGDRDKHYDRRDDRRDDNRDDRNWDYNNRDRDYNDKYSKNAPRKVRDAFNRDYPNASNVSWTKDRGTWTANFKRGGLFGGNNSVSYRANGERVGSNNNNNGGVFGRRTNDDRSSRNDQQRRW